MKKQILKLKEPSLKCIDMVVSELTTTIRKSSLKVKYLTELSLTLEYSDGRVRPMRTKGPSHDCLSLYDERSNNYY